MRADLSGISRPGDHAGLLLARFLKAHDNEKATVRELHGEAAGIGISDLYHQAFTRWKAAHSDHSTFEGTLSGPMALGLGNENVLENGLTLSHAYGTPLIPGSALKGLCRRGATRAELTSKTIGTLFGVGSDAEGQDGAGYVTFFDAWLVPSETRPLMPDTITVHHQGYYGEKGKNAPTDSDDPNPVPLLVVAPGTRFFFALDAPSSEWGQLAKQSLQWSLQNLGIGGKTSAGYGFFTSEWVERPTRL